MSVDNPTAPFILVVDTNMYAGNFEREMVAYITGQVGDCEVGDDMVERFREELEEKGMTEEAIDTYLEELGEKVQQVQDDNGCWRPASIWPTPGRWNNGRGGHFDDADFESMKGDAWQGSKWPAYESVAAFFDKCPTPDELKMFVERARNYVANIDPTGRGRMKDFYKDEDRPALVIRGIRLVEQKIQKTEEVIHIVGETSL